MCHCFRGEYYEGDRDEAESALVGSSPLLKEREDSSEDHRDGFADAQNNRYSAGLDSSKMKTVDDETCKFNKRLSGKS